MTPPIVAPGPASVPPSAGSSASIWPSASKVSCASRSGTPASITAVKSPTLCSSSRCRPPVSISTPSPASQPGPHGLVPPPRGRTGRPSSPSERRRPAASSAVSGRAAISPPPSEPLRQPGGLQRVLPVDAGHLAAQPRGRHDLAGVGEPGRVPGAAQLLERGEVVLPEHLRHVLLLVDADAVLAGDRPAGLQARVEDPARELLRARGLALAAPVEAHQRMQVAVARVEDVGHEHAVLLRQR